jgi:hypothetical protein
MANSVTEQGMPAPPVPTRVDTATVINTLSSLFQTVTSGEPYNREQIKDATRLASGIVSAARFEFDVFKHYTSRAYNSDRLIEARK